MTMGEPVFWGRFALAVLSVWRIAHLVSQEDGPGAVIARRRAALGRSILGEMMDCFGCVSLWVAAPFVLFVGDRIVDIEGGVVIWLAVSGAALLIDRWTPEPITIDQTDNSSPMETEDGML